MARSAILAGARSLLCALLLMTGLMAAQAADPLSPPVPVKVGTLNSLSGGPIFVALERGYFAEEGLEVELLDFVNTATMTAPLSTGQLDIGSGAPTVGFLNAINRGIGMKLVADKGRNSKGHGFNALVVRKELIDDGTVKSLADLEGLTIGSPSRMSPVDLELDHGLNSVGLSIDDVNIEIMRFPDMIAAMGNGAIDAAILIEPLVTLAEVKNVGVRFMGVDEMYPDFQIAGILYGPEFIKNKPEAAKRWMVAYLRGIRDFVDGLEDKESDAFAAIVDILVKHTRANDPKAYKRMVMPGYDPDGYLNLQNMRESIAWYERRGGVEDAPALADFVDYGYLDYAHERLGRRGEKQTVK